MVTYLNIDLTKVLARVQFIYLFSSSFYFTVLVLCAFGMLWVVPWQLSMTVETDWYEIVLIIVVMIFVYMMNLHICAALLTAETTVTGTP